MNVAAILALVVELLPVVKQLSSVVVDNENSDVEEVLEWYTEMAGPIKELMTKIEMTRTQTESNHPEVWAAVREDWNAAVQGWLNKP